MLGMHHHLQHQPSILARVAAPVARVWQDVQNRVVQLVGFKNANTASAVVGVAGLTTMAVASILGPIGPAIYGVGMGLATAGAVGWGENKLTGVIARSDGKGRI